jgi:hypothetical protein
MNKQASALIEIVTLSLLLACIAAWAAILN